MAKAAQGIGCPLFWGTSNGGLSEFHPQKSVRR